MHIPLKTYTPPDVSFEKTITDTKIKKCGISCAVLCKTCLKIFVIVIPNYGLFVIPKEAMVGTNQAKPLGMTLTMRYNLLNKVQLYKRRLGWARAIHALFGYDSQ